MAGSPRTVLPIDLDAYPEVDEFLSQLDLGPFVRATVTAPVGRNNAWAGTTTRGHEVFVKRLVGGEQDRKARMRRMLSFERFVSTTTGVRGPGFLGSDDERHLVAFEHVTDAQTGAQLMVDETFTGELAHRVGQTIGRLHGTPPPEGSIVEETTPPFPPHSFLRGLPMALYVASSAAELEAWRLLQSDPEAGVALNRLAEMEKAAPKLPAHCDFRVDQILLRGGDLYIADWEEFRLADPARDVGAFAGEWIYRSVLDLVTDRGDVDFVDMEFTHELILQRGAEKMRRLLPLVADFWRGYREVRPDVDEQMPIRATAFAGWHLLDRLIAGAATSNRLSGIVRAAAGVGRGALVNPSRFSSTLGFGDVR